MVHVKSDEKGLCDRQTWLPIVHSATMGYNLNILLVYIIWNLFDLWNFHCNHSTKVYRMMRTRKTIFLIWFTKNIIFSVVVLVIAIHCVNHAVFLLRGRGWHIIFYSGLCYHSSTVDFELCFWAEYRASSTRSSGRSSPCHSMNAP